MATVQKALTDLLDVDGALCAALVDSTSGMLLGSSGSGLDLELAAAGHTEVVRAKIKAMHAPESGDAIDDILITQGTQYHIIRPLARQTGLFLYLVLDKLRSNLAQARRKCAEVEKTITI